MSTDLYRVRVLSLEPELRRVTFRIFLVYYDFSGLPTDASFFFRILWDEADTRGGGGGPLGDAVSVDDFLEEAWVDQHTHRFVERVTRLSAKNLEFGPDNRPPTFIYEHFTDEGVLTQGDYQVIVTDLRWMQHLRVGQTWQTTSYETRAAMPKERATVLLDQAPPPPPAVEKSPKPGNSPVPNTNSGASADKGQSKSQNKNQNKGQNKKKRKSR